MWKGIADSKKAKRLSKEEIRKQLLDLIIIDKNLEFDDLNKEAEEIQDPEKSAEIIRQYEDIIKTKKKGIINVAFHQGQIFKKFKEKEKFAKLVNELGIHKTTIIFKIIFKLSIIFERFYLLKLSLYYRHTSKNMKVFKCIHFRLHMYLF